MSACHLASCTLDDLRPFLDDDARCLDLFASWRWPQGFRCPRCASTRGSVLRARRLWECRACGRQVSVTAGTPLHRTKIPLRHWLYALWMVGHRKQSISALQLQKELGLGSYETAWAMLHKIRRVLHDAFPRPLTGPVDVGVLHLAVPTLRPGVPGRRGWHGPRLHTLGVVVERLPGDGNDRSRAGDIRFHFLEPDNDPTKILVAQHEQATLSGAGRLWHWVPPVVRTILANVQAWLDGTFHGVTAKYLPAYLDEFAFRFRHRDDESSLPSLIVARLLEGQPLPRTALRNAPIAPHVIRRPDPRPDRVAA